MTRLALLIRGINVGRNNSLPMATLRRLLQQKGCTDVSTLLQSGNAVFNTARPRGELQSAIDEALEHHMGRPIGTVICTAADLRKAVADNPFGKVATDPARLCLSFCSERLTAELLAPLAGKDYRPELWQLRARCLYTWHPHGQGKSPLAAALARLKWPGTITTRNWNTVLKLLQLMSSGRVGAALGLD